VPVDLHGIYPPMATPFTEGDQSIDYDAVRFNVGRWMRTGLRGLVVLGTNGEAGVVGDEEAEALVEVVRDGVPRGRWLIVGTGRDSTLATVAACRRAAKAGADLVLVRPPALFKAQMTGDVLERHFRAVADASPVPVLLYTFPQAFGVGIAVATIERLAEHPNIAGMKDSSGDLAQITEEVHRTPASFQVVVGAAATLHASLLAGATGGVVALANVLPDHCVRLLELVDEGRHEQARALQWALTGIAKAVTSGFGVAGLKAAMTLAGYRGGVPRSPLGPLAGAAMEQLRALLDDVLRYPLQAGA